MGEFVDTNVNLKNKTTNRAMDHDEGELELVSCKKRKLYVEVGYENYDDVVVESENTVSSVSSKCDDTESSNSNCRSPDLKDVHFETEDFETEVSNCLFSPRNEICVDNEQGLMCKSTTSYRKSPPTQSRPHRGISAVVMPSEEELEEFFVAAEKAEEKRFAEKYNYDIVKDVPLEGKYEWIHRYEF